MDFGKVQYIDNIDFTLPPDAPVTEALWQHLEKVERQPLRVHVGGTEWGRASWLGRVYPRGTKQKDFLTHYSRQLNTVELNSLFYGLQPPATIERWASMTREGFRFCPKFLETISHRQQLVNAGADTEAFIDTVRLFGDKLGPCFLQLSEAFGPDRSAILLDYVSRLPRGLAVAVELRQANWFKPGAGRDTWELFRQLGIGTVMTDVAGRRDVLHMRLTTPVAFIRFVTNGLHPADYTRADAWAERIREWAGKGLRDLYFFVHSPDEQTSPEMMSYIIGRFNDRLGAGLKAPNLANGGQPETLSLF